MSPEPAEPQDGDFARYIELLTAVQEKALSAPASMVDASSRTPRAPGDRAPAQAPEAQAARQAGARAEGRIVPPPSAPHTHPPTQKASGGTLAILAIVLGMGLLTVGLVRTGAGLIVLGVLARGLLSRARRAPPAAAVPLGRGAPSAPAIRKAPGIT